MEKTIVPVGKGYSGLFVCPETVFRILLMLSGRQHKAKQSYV